MSGETLDFKKHLCIHLVYYCQVHEENIPHNSQAPRTKEAICLNPSGNLQRGYKFMALNSGKKIARQNWDLIPMPDRMIARINTLGRDQSKLLTLICRHGRLIGDVETQ